MTNTSKMLALFERCKHFTVQIQPDRVWVKRLLSICLTLIISIVEQMVLFKISAPYSESVFQICFSILKEQGLYELIIYLFNRTMNNLETINLPTILQTRQHTLLFFYLLYSVAFIISFIELIIKRSYYGFVQFYLLCGFLIGYCMIYTGSEWTLCRGINAALYIVFILLSIGEQRTRCGKMRIWVIGIVLFGSIQIWNYYSGVITDRISVAQHRDKILAEKSILTEIIDIVPQNERWSNTIAYYNTCDYGYLAVPKGSGLNWMRNNEENNKAKYVMIRNNTNNIEKIVSLNETVAHKIIYNDEMFVVLKKESETEKDD